MGLAEVQVVLAKLFTDEDLRNRFFADPIAVGRSMSLDEHEAVGLAQLSTIQVSRFADSLHHKRVDDARKVLPISSRALGAAFAARLLEAVNAPLTAGRHHDDACAFVIHLEQLARSKQLDPPWAADLARYELSFVDTLSKRSGLIVRWFRYPVGQMADAIHRGELISKVKRGRAIGIWLRIPGRRGLIHRLLFS